MDKGCWNCKYELSEPNKKPCYKCLWIGDAEYSEWKPNLTLAIGG